MASVTVHALSTGSLTLPERFFVSPADQKAQRSVPSLSFLVQHRSSASKLTRLVFDLGLRRDVSLYPKALEEHCISRSPMSTQPDAVKSLAMGGLTVDDIDCIMFSHVHYDHVGLPKDFTNPKTKFIIGPGASDLLSGKTKLNIGRHNVFEEDLLPLNQTTELPSTHANSSSTGADFQWSTDLPPFEHVIDFFGDGTVYIVSAPGHLQGHINLLCKLTPKQYVLLAGDACHDMRLFTGECDIATWTDEEGNQCCIHHDIPKAKDTIKRLAEVSLNGLMVDGEKADVEVVFAHNWAWEEDAKVKGKFWPGHL